MQSRKNHDKASKASKETPPKIASKPQASKASPRRKFPTRTDDIKNVQSTLHRNQSPSPSRGSSRASSSPVSSTSYVSDACTSLSKVEDATTATSTSMSSSPVNAGPSSYRAQWVLSRKLSGRSRFSELQGKSKVAVRVADDGKIYIKRSSEDRTLDPDRLMIDRCNLTRFPIIEGEEQLHLLNLQQNQITVIENLEIFSNLKFLDLSDNLFEQITGLDNLFSLRVLILSRNRIHYIDGLQNLNHLDVLDLSGNEIKEITNVHHLHELRVLNLSSNHINQISGLRGLKSLVELNLNKNFILEVTEVDVLPRLQRLFLSQNSIERFEDMYCVSNVPLLCDLSLEGCPITVFPNYRHLILYNIPQLKVLDTRRALDEERRTAQALMRKEEQRRQEGIRQAKVKEAKIKAIATARQLWETSCKEPETLLQRESPSSTSSIASAVPLHLLATRSCHSFSEEEEDLFCSYCGGQGGECSACDGGRLKIMSNGLNQKSRKSKQRSQKRGHDVLKANKKSRTSVALDLEVADSRLTYLAELEFGNLQLYGPGAVAATISNTWAPQTVALIHTVCFHFIVFDSIAHLLGKMKTQFPNIEAASFECTCIESLSQLNALGQIPGLKILTIESEGNPILQLSLWRMYAVYRLGPTIELINGATVTELERVRAEDIFGGLGFAASLLLPKYRLSSLLNSPRVKQMFLKEKGYSPNSLQRQPDCQVAAEVMKAAFTYNPDYEYSLPGYKTTASKIVEKNLLRVEEALKKRLVFQRLWPSMFLGIVNDALEDYIDLNRHMKLSMLSLLKKCKSLDESDSND
ncbi:leucine-rich repeat-containing protein 49-like isoform X2 [Uloborus diversus]|uniref:leucine-rich repeat-containing protein 49-like isoform X2 n=1 Tax=Uloborus diversus TaxID=327109 RepID=UPI00240A4DE7|nr:leucine-rich repeat-containing protein 49-like isoform X2 [Uloborus diversus]XP_054724699.1 leucine-rich repeat-containing protein 49-like isoform X2 [Uloborus diversus]